MNKFQVGKKYCFSSTGNYVCECILTTETQAVLKSKDGHIFIPRARDGFWSEVKEEPRKAAPKFVGIYEAENKTLFIGPSLYYSKESIKENQMNYQDKLIDIIEVNYEEKGQEV